MTNVVKLESRRAEASLESEVSPPSRPELVALEPEIAEIKRPETEEQPKATPPPASPWRPFFRVMRIALRGVLLTIYLTLRTIIRYLFRHPLHAAVTSVLVLLLALMITTGSEIHNQMILGKISDQTIDRIIEGSRFQRTFDAAEVDRSAGRDLLRVGAPDWMQKESVRAILFSARKAGLPIEDQAVLLAIADIESGFNPMARAPTTTACGLFQFVKRTGEMFSLATAECMDPWQNARAGVAHYLFNLERRVAPQTTSLAGAERVFRLFELSYYLHHDGPESSNPSNDVKATILNGTQFLFKAYHALELESESQHHAPSFAEQFESNLLAFLDDIQEFFSGLLASRAEAAEAEISLAPTPYTASVTSRATKDTSVAQVGQAR